MIKNISCIVLLALPLLVGCTQQSAVSQNTPVDKSSALREQAGHDFMTEINALPKEQQAAYAAKHPDAVQDVVTSDDPQMVIQLHQIMADSRPRPSQNSATGTGKGEK